MKIYFCVSLNTVIKCFYVAENTVINMKGCFCVAENTVIDVKIYDTV